MRRKIVLSGAEGAASKFAFRTLFEQHCTMGHISDRVARLFLTQNTKTKENMPNYHNTNKWPLNIPNGH
jgi:hypothetical protein